MTLFAFVDIETTGLDPKTDHILEIAWQLTDAKFNALGPARSFLVEHGHSWGEVFNKIRTNEPVRDMHTESGLLQGLVAKSAHDIAAIAEAFAQDLKDQRTEGETIHLAGFSVEFDRTFLMNEPGFYALLNGDWSVRIHHRLLNLSAVKLFFEATGVPFEKASNEGPHRARNDVAESVAQARIFARTFGALAVNA